MKNSDVGPAHLNAKTAEERNRERGCKRGLRKLTLTVRAQTIFHLTEMSLAMNGGKDLGRVVDKLVREHQLAHQCVIKEAQNESPD